MTNLPQAVRQAWHMAALSRQIGEGTVRAVEVCGTPLALFRAGGKLGALVDRCPHRNYPLSLGRVQQGTLECPYHGWRFAADGACVAVPGCRLDDAGRLSAEPVRVHEAHGAVFVALDPSAPAAPDLPPDFANPSLDHFWWEQGTWTGRAFDAIENVMDPFHTNHLHDRLIRRSDRRQPVRLLVDSAARSIAMTIEQARPDPGWMARLFERERVRSVSRYYPPTTVQARWEGHSSLTLCVTAIFTPVNDDSFMPFARFSTPKGLAPAWLKEWVIRLFQTPVVAQDRQALAHQHAVMRRFGNPQFTSGPGDLLGNRLHRLWRGETLAERSDPPVDAAL